MIGLKRGAVQLSSHYKKWEKFYEQEKANLKNIIGNDILGIEHVGSTAIQGISAKPIIDIIIGVSSLGCVKKYKNKLVKLNYTHRSKRDTAEQILYVKGPEEKRTVYLHFILYNDKAWKNYLLFRDYLKKNSQAKNKYAKLKQTLAKKYPNNRKAYTKGKDRFIKDIIKTAKNKSPHL